MNVLKLLAAAPLAAVLLGCTLSAQAAGRSPTTTSSVTNRFTITGMHCDACAKGLTSELKRTRGVTTATVTFTNKLAVVVHDTNRVSVETLRKVVAEAGYAAQLAPAAPAPRR